MYDQMQEQKGSSAFARYKEVEHMMLVPEVSHVAGLIVFFLLELGHTPPRPQS